MFANKTEVICTQESEENNFLPLSSMIENNLFFTAEYFLIFLEVFSQVSARMTACNLLLS